MGRRRIVYVSGTRADYGLMKNVLKSIHEHPKLELKILVLGMHLMEEFGCTVEEIKKDGFAYEIVDSVYEQDSKESMAKFVGDATSKISVKLSKIKPDIVFVQGDRSEMLAAATAATYLGIPIVHTHGGDVSAHVDESSRHAITKLAHIHFPATKYSAERIKRMGEQEWRIHISGAPSLDNILKLKINKLETYKKYNLDRDRKLILVVQHPVYTEVVQAPEQIRNTLRAVSKFDAQVIIIYPNADAGGRAMIKVIEEYANDFKIYKTLPYEDFIGLMSVADVMIGNSSAGVIETASLKLPVVNIGTRQKNRERSVNVIDSSYNESSITAAIKKAMSKEFTEYCNKFCKNIYGEGKAGEKIADVLSNIEINKSLLQKQLTYSIMKVQDYEKDISELSRNTEKRFKNWEYPEFDERGYTKYGWRCFHNKYLKLKEGCDIGAFSLIQARYGVEIGKTVEIGPFCYVCSWSTIDNKKGKVIIKDNARIGAYSTVMPGVTVGENSIVGAYSFVNKDIPDNVIAFGIPVRIEGKVDNKGKRIMN